MHARRTLFVPLQPRASLAPIYAALLLLMLLAAIAMAIAFWPSDRAPEAFKSEGETAPAGGSSEPTPGIARDPRGPQRPKVWM